ncbi:hypothetical protein MB901379_02449 [Mycobacterium basiliense]|uniref:UsfY protein n=1 Tax=Mycobacterium basiliense TaxID=2094119 RepID=A0A447GEJ4_9MYCO|nr:hypothetical protein MB901379_02449 [Mycobacterium basiliense]
MVAGVALAFVVSMATVAIGQVGVGIAAAIVGLFVSGGGLSWLTMQRRRIREAEWHASWGGARR